ncbi:Hypothetical Protein SLY_0650 [Strawberry lethal yellows phytoplasma (CPA) str. NZSb11]|uniref:Uncharacterized protein n=1 Tax=Strawberry lethal yellows phytoplasma (CPA) str. NZSb11 TaxID=980422 RepID=R4RQ01_PHYAS|nr:Hypothetical Protein SLY_0650 [Strawberry lethal yellows phytoplasma (CPA) str. NZSb11]
MKKVFLKNVLKLMGSKTYGLFFVFKKLKNL